MLLAYGVVFLLLFPCRQSQSIFPFLPIYRHWRFRSSWCFVANQSGVDDALLVMRRLILLMRVLLFLLRDPPSTSYQLISVLLTMASSFLFNSSCSWYSSFNPISCVALVLVSSSCIVMRILVALTSTSRLLVSVAASTKRMLYRFCDHHFCLTNTASRNASTQYNLVELLAVAISFLLSSYIRSSLLWLVIL